MSPTRACCWKKSASKLKAVESSSSLFRTGLGHLRLINIFPKGISYGSARFMHSTPGDFGKRTKGSPRTMRSRNTSISFHGGPFTSLIHVSGFQVVTFRARTFIAGDYASVLLQLFRIARIPTEWLITLNAATADSLPPRLVSGWMFVCRAR